MILTKHFYITPTFKVEIKSVNGDPGMSTLWVSKDETARVVKYEIVIAEMQGATMLGEAK